MISATVEGDAAGGLDWLPLMEAQSGLWFAQALDPGNPIYNTAHYVDLAGPLDVDAFARAVDRAMGEAQALALRFDEGGGAVRQAVDPARRPRLRHVDVGDQPDPHAAAMTAIRRDHETPVDPVRDPLAATMLFRLAPDRHIWSLRVHHLATDGYGMVLIANRVAELYNGGDGQPFAPLAGVAAEDAAYRASDRRADDAAWWHETMEGAPDVAGLAPGRAVSAHRFHRWHSDLPADFTARLKARADAARLSWPDLLTALAAAYCRRFAGAREAIIGMPWMGRMGSASARVPAMVMNVLPLRIAPDEAAPMDEWLALAARAMTRARRHGRYRGEQLRRDLGLIGGQRRLHGALVNILPFDKPPRMNGLDVRVHVLGTGPVDDISFTFRGDASPALTLEVDANPDLYSSPEVAAHGERLAHFLSAALDADRLADVPIATPAEAAREIGAFNATAHDVPDTTLTELLETAMRTHADSIALEFGDDTLTYADLDRRSAALARALVARGGGPDDRIAIALPRSLELLVALVAVLRAGGAYLPLDMDHPPARIAAILTAADPRAVLAFDNAGGLFDDRLLAAADWPREGGPAAGSAMPSHAAYVIYTSGSTGDPKGVVVEHRAIVNRLLWMRDHYGFGPHSRILQKTPATFDVSVWEFFLALISGGTLAIAPPGAHREPSAIAGLIRRHRITDLHFVPSMLAAFLSTPEAAGLDITRVFCSGEELPADLRDRFHRTVEAELHNLYGPTEAAVDVSYWPAAATDMSRPVPIGWPVWNTRLLVLDDAMRPVAPGMAGQLWLGGVQLARGYLGRPDLTADRFVADPFHPGERLYRTGDVARRRGDGAVVFLGRDDHQVKIRGLRIELGEIEAAIAATGHAREAVVIAREDRPGDRRIVAYVVGVGGAGDNDAAALRSALAARLPDYMIPAAFVTLDAMPVTANGKLDRKALPAPQFTAVEGRAPTTATERALCAMVGDVLGLPEPVAADADFFALGGDSLLAVNLMTRIRERWGRDPGLGALFDRPHVADLAAAIDAESPDFDNGLGPLIRLAEGEADLPPLFVVHPAGGIAWGYRTLARALSPRRAVHGLQSPALDVAAALPESIDALADLYVDRIRAVGAPGPRHLLGWSVGGIIAQAMAARLESLGEPVGLVAMLDSYPAECWRAEPEPTETQALRALLAVAGHDPEAHPHLVTREAIVAFLRAGGSPLGTLPDAALDGVIRVVLDTNRLIRAHHHRPYGGLTTHLRAALDHQDKALTPDLWRPHAPRLDMVDLPFLHSQLTSPAASEMIAPLLDARMVAAERNRT